MMFTNDEKWSNTIFIVLWQLHLLEVDIIRFRYKMYKNSSCKGKIHASPLTMLVKFDVSHNF